MSSTGRDSGLNGSGDDGNHSLHQRLTEVSQVQAQAQDHLNLPSASRSSSLRRTLADEQSGTATPLSEDAPPSLHATSIARQQIRAAHKRREFPSIEFQARLSHFDPASDYHDFRGFFVLFWIGLAIMVITAMLRNMKETGWPFVFRQRQLFVENIWELLSSDAVMMASTLLNVPLHRWYASSSGALRWKSGGVWLQTAFQAAWLLYWVQWPFMRQWTWTAQVFFTLHLLVLFMKMHSYAFYSGYLGETKRRLDDLDNPEVGSVRRVRTPLIRYPSTTAHIAEIRKLQEENVKAPELKTVTELREDLAREITSPLGHVTYPANVSYYNFFDFLCCPTLCYEIEYPRTNKIRPTELMWKGLAVFGCIFLMTLTTEEFVLPVLDEARVLLLSANSFTDAALIFAETISRLLFPFMVIFLLLFLALFEYLCNFFAEVTREYHCPFTAISRRSMLTGSSYLYRLC